jgi:hypothetical protein
MPPAVTAEAPTAAVDADIENRIGAEVAKAVAASEERQFARTLDLVNTKLKEAKLQQREGLLMIRDYLERMEKKSSMIRRTMYDQ